MGYVQVLTREGDETIIEWDPADDQSVGKAHEQWDKLKKEGYEFFEVADAKGKHIKRFNKGLGRVIAAPGVKKAEDKVADARPAAMGGGPVAQRC